MSKAQELATQFEHLSGVWNEINNLRWSAKVVSELRRLDSANKELLEFAEEVRRTGDTRLASMAIAVIAKATGNQP